ncbi:MAG: hypothetical protein NC394_08310 [Bacteroides sp.]|nr:hypothetical protein [Bacteroides sp.]
MKKRLNGALSLAGLIGAYLILRYPLFFLHGMKQWPFILFAFGGIVIAVSGLVFGKKILPLSTLIGYTVGFVLGYLFQFDYGIGLNSLWIIWTCVYLAAVFVGSISEICFRNKKM